MIFFPNQDVPVKAYAGLQNSVLLAGGRITAVLPLIAGFVAEIPKEEVPGLVSANEKSSYKAVFEEDGEIHTARPAQ